MQDFKKVEEAQRAKAAQSPSTMIYAHCTCEETQAALGDSGPCSFCWAGGAEDDRCVACPHCHRIQIPHDPAGACAVCEKPLARASVMCPTCLGDGPGSSCVPCGGTGRIPAPPST